MDLSDGVKAMGSDLEISHFDISRSLLESVDSLSTRGLRARSLSENAILPKLFVIFKKQYSGKRGTRLRDIKYMDALVF